MLLAVVFFNESVYSATEGTGNVQPVLVLSSPLLFDITVQVETTATGKLANVITNSNASCVHSICKGDDISSGPFNVTFFAGDTHAVFNVTIIDDNVVEGVENFSLSIDPTSLPRNVSVGNPSQITLLIFDNDSKYKLIYN